ncbi:hypothetical protein [uncultured Paludibaculum sp.]|uniref:hypothetical protein n=1 Tax=uncultured Paludibaculum sp. TaxID=1765020 RepID=UPI002AAA8963|nr:hypothetical protein [uncultured Paludibaculum sp.]
MLTKSQQHKEDLRAVARHVHENPMAEHKEIADELELTPAQVKHALDELKQEGHVVGAYLVDLEFLGYPLRYRVDIFVTPANLRDGKGGLPEDDGQVDSQKKLAQYILKKLPTRKPFAGKILVEDVRILLGSPADLSATVRARDTEAILEFVTQGLRMCRAISQTASCLEAWSCRDGVISPNMGL